MEFEKEADAKALKGWNNSKNPFETKVKNIIKIWQDTDSDYPRRFFLRHPEIIPYDLRMFVTIVLPTMTENDKDNNVYNIFTTSKSDVKTKLKIILDTNKSDLGNGFARRFFLRHPELLPPELNPFLINKENNNELKLKKDLLEKEKEILELKLKLSQLEQK